MIGDEITYRSYGFKESSDFLSGRRALCVERSEPEKVLDVVQAQVVDRAQVRMQTRVAINRVRIPVAVNPRFPGPGSSSQG